jgi:hypothetical protein
MTHRESFGGLGYDTVLVSQAIKAALLSGSRSEMRDSRGRPVKMEIAHLI